MSFKEIKVTDLQENAIKIISDEYMLITAANKERHNMMTASWGGLGEMWEKHVSYCVVRPQRYTRDILETTDKLTLSFFGNAGKNKVHKICGSKSGRDIDKTAECGLTPINEDGYTYFEESRLILKCKILYIQRIDEACFKDKTLVDKWFPQKDFHYMYISKIESCLIK